MPFLSSPKDAGKHFNELKTRQESDRLEVKYFDLKRPGDSAEVVFLDGDLCEDGYPSCPTLYQHTVFLDKKPTRYACTKSEGNCPLCEENVPKAFVGLFTVFNVSGIKGKDGQYYYKNTRQIFAAKQSVFVKLAGLAKNRNGLRGWKCTIQRTNDEKAPRTGDLFDFTKQVDLAKIEAKLPGESMPFNYQEVVLQLTSSELRAKGFGVTKSSNKDDPDLASLQKDLADLDKVPGSSFEDDTPF